MTTIFCDSNAVAVYGVFDLRIVEERCPFLVADERAGPFGVIPNQRIGRHMKVSRLDAEGSPDRRMDLVPSESAIIGDVEILTQSPIVAEKSNERHGEVDSPGQRPGRSAVASDQDRLPS